MAADMTLGNGAEAVTFDFLQNFRKNKVMQRSHSSLITNLNHCLITPSPAPSLPFLSAKAVEAFSKVTILSGLSVYAIFLISC
jgi:hypothetical protein